MLINKSEQRELEAQSETGMAFAIERWAYPAIVSFPYTFEHFTLWVENICFLVRPSYDSCL